MIPYIPDGNGEFLSAVVFSILFVSLFLFGIIAWISTMVRDVRQSAWEAKPKVESAITDRIRARAELTKAQNNVWTYETKTTTDAPGPDEVPSGER